MKPLVKDILQVLEKFAPSALAEKWDNVGLLVGSPQNSVNSILIGLDATNTLVEEAIEVGADTIITHHPVIFKPLSAIHTNDPAGRLLQKALSNDISIIGCHTNLDSTVDGVNDVLAGSLGLQNLEPLQPNEGSEDKESGLGRIGVYQKPLSRDDFLAKIFEVLKLDTFNMVGELPESIANVALCGGSGSDFAELAYSRGADVYLSAEIKHSTAVWAKEAGFAIIDGTHYATEKPATYYLTEKLRGIAAGFGWQIEIHLTETETHPFVSVHISKYMTSKT